MSPEPQAIHLDELHSTFVTSELWASRGASANWSLATTFLVANSVVSSQPTFSNAPLSFSAGRVKAPIAPSTIGKPERRQGLEVAKRILLRLNGHFARSSPPLKCLERCS